MIFSPVFIRSLVYAGMLSNILAIIVCLVFREYSFITGKSFSLSIWLAVYIVHKKFFGTW